MNCTALAALPIVFVFPLYDAWRRRGTEDEGRPVLLWSVPLIVVITAIVVILIAS